MRYDTAADIIFLAASSNFKVQSFQGSCCSSRLFFQLKRHIMALLDYLILEIEYSDKAEALRSNKSNGENLVD